MDNNHSSIQPILNLTIRGLQWLPEQLGKATAFLCVVLVLDVFVVVVLRYGFDQPSLMLQETGMWLHSSIFLLGVAYTLAADEHVRVDIFYRKASPRYRAWVDIFGTLLLLLPVCGYLFINSWDYVAISWRIKETSSEAGGLPALYLLKTLLLLMPILLTLQGFALVLKNVALIKGVRIADPETKTDIGVEV